MSIHQSTVDKFDVLDEMLVEGWDRAEAFLKELTDDVEVRGDDEDYRKLVLLKFLIDEGNDALAGEIQCQYDEVYEYGNQQWMVLTDDEADEKWDDSLESYIDKCILCNLDGIAAQYFDREKWKRDARMDGRGHSLSPYNGEEYSEGEFFLYRVN